MNKRIHNIIRRTVALLTVLLISAYSFATSVVVPVDCSVSVSHGDGYTTTISTVTKVSAGYQIVLTCSYDGSTGGKGLDHYSIQANSGTFSNVSFNAVSGNTTGTLNLGPQLVGDPFTTGFQINKITNFGRGIPGSFTVTYTVSTLQNQQVDAVDFQDNGNTKTQDNLVSFQSADFQSVYSCLSGCATPTLTPASGTYSSAQTVTMSTATAGAAIYYTTNGSTPTTGSTKYTSPIIVSTNETVKAIAALSGLNNSGIASETYTIAPPVATPTFSPSPGTFTSAQNVTLSCSTSGATIRYTTDGSTPNLTSPIYSSPISVSSFTTINAIGVMDGYTNSAVASGSYNVLLPVAAPVFTPQAGTYNTTQNVAISSSTSGASIYYTTDGSTPTINSTLYTSPISVDISQTISAIAVKNGMTNSGVTSSSYVIKCATPTLTPGSGTYNTIQSVAISSTTPGVSIRYTTDGSDPSATNGTLYTGPITVNATYYLLIKAIAYKTGATNSDIGSSNYVVSLLKVSNPVMSPGAGSYSTYQSVSIMSPTSGASIKYTTDGSQPSATNGTVYTGPISVTSNMQIIAYAYKDGMSNSDNVYNSYSIQLLPVDAPTFSPSAGAYTTAQSVTISSTTSGASIYYTTDGSTPTTSSNLYTGAVTVAANTTLTAIAVKPGMLNSQVTSSSYIIKCAMPTLTPGSGTYNTIQSVAINSTTPGASIRYTTDGSDPSATNGMLYTAPITVNATYYLLIKAIAYKAGITNSDIASSNYVVSLVKVANPVVSPGQGTYYSTQNVTITCPTDGASIIYTTDGSQPSATNGTLYTGPVTINAGNTMLNVYAYKYGMADSYIVYNSYYVQLTSVAQPTFTPAAGTYTGTQSVALASTTTGASIYYTTDGTTPTTSSNLYSGAISISANTTLNAIAVKSGMSNSTVTSGSYMINCATPVLTPATGTYTSAQSVSISTTTSGASIYYTTDGSTPTSSSTLYTGAITVGANATIKAIVIKTGMGNSAIASETYTISIPVTSPIFTPPAGTYNSAQSVTITSSISGASIRYTTDGSTPSETVGTVYTGSVAISGNTTLKAIAYKSGMADSPVTSGSYVINCATPTLSPATGSYTSAQSVSMSTTTTGASIYYTTDGTTPTTSSTLYSSAISVGSNMTIKAIAVKSGMGNSGLASETYTILLPVTAPTFTPAAGTYTTAQSVTLASITSGASIYYTTDGTTPTASSNAYTGAINISANTTLNAIAVKSGMSNSTVTSGSYVINCATPVLTPATGTYTSAQSVSISTTTSGASIYYTTDGSTPTSSSTLYTGAITVGANATIKAIVIKTGMGNSAIASETYTISIPVTSPIFTPPAGTYNSAQSVTITSSISGASIRYTTDGSTPSETVGTVYTGSVAISGNTTLKAIAYKSGMADSPVTSGSYVINCATPTLSPATGSYTSAQSVSMSTTTTGASIYYTTDGTTPTTSSTLYSSAISVGSNMTIKAIAVKSGMGNSGLASETYTILLSVAAPTYTPGAGSYTTVQAVTIGTTTPNADIYYTLDGTDPTTSSPHYTGPVSVGTSLTLKAVAIKSGMTNSQITSGSYVILLPVAAPQFSPAAGTFTSAQSVTLTSATSGASIYYTTDGTDPTTSSSLYSIAVAITANTTLKAIAIKTGMSNSPITSGVFTILGAASDPTFTPVAGTYTGSQTITIATTSTGAKINYTTDGSTPSATVGTQYTGPITIGVNTTIKAIAYGTTYANSNVVSNVYNIKVATPVLSVLAGTYNLPQSLSITCSTANAKIYYTTDGTTPSATNGTFYTGAIAIGVNTNINVIAINTGMTNSDPVSANYVISLDKVASPTFTPIAGIYAGSQSVTIASSTAGVSIVYTLDGTLPSKTNGIAYTSPVTIGSDATLKAYAYKTNMIDSDVASGDYKIKPAVITYIPVPGNYTTAQSVVLACVTPGVTIRYTTDGTVPSKTVGSVYSAAISLSANTTLKAIAYKTGLEDGDVVSGDYTFQLAKVANPTYTPVAGSYTTPQSVTLSTTTANASIRYTTDGTIPTNATGTVYTAPIVVSTTTTINAIAYVTGFSDSDVVPGKYVINLGGVDTDGDGVPDNQDDYPTDPTRAFNNYYPGIGFGSLAFEDNWPYKADYDMNDMVVDYRFNQITNSDNEVVEIRAKLVLRAMGATFHNGFGIELPVLPSQVSSCVATLKNGSAVPVGNLVTIDPVKGLEANQAKAVVILYDDGYNILPQLYPGIGVNTNPSVPFVTPDTINLVITFTEPISSDVFTSPVYNPFIFANKTRSTEIHLPNFPPTSLANTGLFNTGEDTSTPSTGRYYKTSNNLPWAINVYEGYNYPVEKVAIVTAFLHFAEWAQSGGTLYPDWYKDLPGYRDPASVYTNK
jgi:LruC domain-containing protein